MIESGPPGCEQHLKNHWLSACMCDYGAEEAHEQEDAGKNRIRIDDAPSTSAHMAVYVDNDAFYEVIVKCLRRKWLDGGQVIQLVRSLVDILYPPLFVHFFRASTPAHAHVCQIPMERKVVNTIILWVHRIMEHYNVLRLQRGSRITILVPSGVVEEIIDEYTRGKRTMFQQSRFGSDYDDKFTYSTRPSRNCIDNIDLLRLTASNIGPRLYDLYRGGRSNGFVVRHLTAQTFLASGRVRDKKWHGQLQPVLHISNKFDDFDPSEAEDEDSTQQQDPQTSSSSSSGTSAIQSQQGLLLNTQHLGTEKTDKLIKVAFNMGKGGIYREDFETWLESRLRNHRPTWLVDALRERYRDGSLAR